IDAGIQSCAAEQSARKTKFTFFVLEFLRKLENCGRARRFSTENCFSTANIRAVGGLLTHFASLWVGGLYSRKTRLIGRNTIEHSTPKLGQQHTCAYIRKKF